MFCLNDTGQLLRDYHSGGKVGANPLFKHVLRLFKQPCWIPYKGYQGLDTPGEGRGCNSLYVDR